MKPNFLSFLPCDKGMASKANAAVVAAAIVPVMNFRLVIIKLLLGYFRLSHILLNYNALLSLNNGVERCFHDGVNTV
jgi:hypothetical protein